MRQIVITGAASGIAHAAMQAFLSDDWAVIAIDRNPATEAHPNLRWLTCDISVYQDVVRMVGAIDGPVDALIHAAAIRLQTPIMADDPRYDDWASTIRINLIGAYNIVQTVIPSMRQSTDARILLFSGGGAFGPPPTQGYSAYAASKAGVVSLMECANMELCGSGITINCVAPGPVHTKLTGSEIPPDDDMALMRAVRFLQFMLGPYARGLTGKAISIPHDGWPALTASNIDTVNASDLWTRTRIKGTPC